MKKDIPVAINFTGGIISPGILLRLLDVAEAAMVKEVRFGLRQQLLIDVPEKNFRSFQKNCDANGLAYLKGSRPAPNVTSTYPATGILLQDSWLAEGVYKDIFDSFEFSPSLKISICDREQTFVPYFSSHINWIAATNQHYWHLAIRPPKSNTILHWPELVYSNNIADVSASIEKMLLAGVTELNELVNHISVSYISLPVTHPLPLPTFHLPYYEGFNREGQQYWLGIYRRNEQFSVQLLKEICNICLETGIGELYATTWKSLIIRHISPAHRPLWDYVLGKHRVNVRHAANELNWIVESEEDLQLKRHIIRHFDREDVRTYGLCFNIRMKSTTGLFGSVIIRLRGNAASGRLRSQDRFDILYARDFNPNASEWILYREQVQKEHLGVYLVSLCKTFYEHNSQEDLLQRYYVQNHIAATAETTAVPLHQCPDCLTVYDPATGDPEQGVTPGTLFSDLPDTYICNVCEAPLACYKTVTAI
ncbi:rubredoxin [Chitinophaga horti]|uniref:Rubredoxin n=1 Tax=Chitinophaga horti TaxID=2920382 RepID=A0ABY6IZT4_9BACT|nr:rubredoxin [Chitinophaga horti]UYQ91412.1 rubredoxin [Chitinophaga horti]